MPQRREHRGTFDCVDKDGQVYVVKYYVTVDPSEARGGVFDHDGTHELVCDGKRLDYIVKGHYQTLDGVELRTDDPRAP
jgi:hypothetical protein